MLSLVGRKYLLVPPDVSCDPSTPILLSMQGTRSPYKSKHTHYLNVW